MKSKSKLLLEVPRVIPLKPATAVIESAPEAEAPTKTVFLEHPLPPVVSADPSVISASKKVFAVVDINGAQFKVTENDQLMVNHLRGVDVGDQLSFDRVLLLGARNFTVLGKPFVANANIIATVREHTTTRKINVFRMKRRTGYRKLNRFHEMNTILYIDKIVASDLPQVQALEEADVNKMQEPVTLKV